MDMPGGGEVVQSESSYVGRGFRREGKGTGRIGVTFAMRFWEAMVGVVGSVCGGDGGCSSESVVIGKGF